MKWFTHSDGQTFGPFTFHQMVELAGNGRLSPDTDVAQIGSEVWTAASDDTALSSLFTKRHRIEDNYQRDDWIEGTRENSPTRLQRIAKLVLPAMAILTLCFGAVLMIVAVAPSDKAEPPAREIADTRATTVPSGVPRSEAGAAQNTGMLQSEVTAPVSQSSTEKACIAASARKIPNSPGTQISASRAKAPGAGSLSNAYYTVEIDARVAGQDVTYMLFCDIADDGTIVTTPIGLR
ncbi:DUF4339 domain-containing protein [Bradyrhizobium sp. 18]|nr:DUF4339 domain-containing protein [Bradyrhizobium sp. 18]